MNASGILKSRSGSGSHLSTKSRPSFRQSSGPSSGSLTQLQNKSKKKKLRKKPPSSSKPGKKQHQSSSSFSKYSTTANCSSTLYSDPALDSGQGSDERCFCDEGDHLSNDSCSTWSLDSCPLCKAELGEHEHIGDDEIVTDESVFGGNTR